VVGSSSSSSSSRSSSSSSSSSSGSLCPKVDFHLFLCAALALSFPLTLAYQLGWLGAHLLPFTVLLLYYNTTSTISR
jgi:hypothetical protein